MLKKAAGIKSGSKTPHTDKVGKVTRVSKLKILQRLKCLI
ncbi:MAG: hypothetical protein R3E08_05055 [Thiotrichaceae bacterium]